MARVLQSSLTRLEKSQRFIERLRRHHDIWKSDRLCDTGRRYHRRRGPAGASAACHLARAGFRVVLLDQRRFPRDKVCGDFVGPAALAELDQLGLSWQPTLQNAHEIRDGALYLNGDKVVARPFPRVAGLRRYGVCIPRILLDDAIVQAAVASGARLIEDARVTGYETDATGVTVFYQGKGGPRSLRSRLL